MALNSVSDWSTTPASNVDVGGVGIQGSSSLASGNDAMQTMMAQLASYTRRGSDLATASTLNLDSVDAQILNLTGTTTVTAVTLTSTHWRICRAVAAFQITASSTLIVNGSTSVNYTTVAGDYLLFEGYGSSTVRVSVIAQTPSAMLPALGTAGQQPRVNAAATALEYAAAWETIYDAAVSAVASVPVTGLSAFRTIKVIFSVKPANDGETFLFQTDANGGASWDTGASDYAFGIRYAAAGSALSVDSGAHSGIYCNYGTTVGSDTIEGLWGEFTFYDFNQATNMRVIGWSAWYNTAASIGEIVRITAVRANTSARDSLRLIGAGNIASGRVTILGLRG